MTIGDVTSADRGSGARYNDGKTALELVPLMAMEDCARVFDYGRKKYAEWNWAKGQSWSAPLGCLLRHVAAWQRGEDNDPESGLPHLGHAMCNLVMLSTFAKTYLEGDDRASRWLSTAPEFEPECGREPEPKPLEIEGDSTEYNPAYHGPEPSADPDLAELAPPNAPPNALAGD